MKRLGLIGLVWLAFVSALAAQEPIFAPGAKLKVEAEGDGAGEGEGPAWHPEQGVLTSGHNGHINLLDRRDSPASGARTPARTACSSTPRAGCSPASQSCGV